MKTYKKIIYLPIETKSREFDSKCLIGLECINQGVAVILSAAGRMKLEHPGVVLLKSAAGFEMKAIENFKSRQISCVVIDEEGFVQTENDIQRSLRYSQETLSAVDKVMFNGQSEHDVMNKYYSIPSDKCVITGNPRLDFYKPKLREYYKPYAGRIKRKYGPYILITSRFGEVNSARKIGYIDFLKNIRLIKNESELEIFSSFLAHSKNIYTEFLNLLPQLATEFKDYTIIVRPHPSELADNWIVAGKGSKNIKVVSEGPIGPWLLAADAVLHNGCTTGLEAFLMDRPVFSYMPVVSDEFDLKLPNKVSIQCYDKDSLIRRMKEILDLGDNFKSASIDGFNEKLEYAELFMRNAGQQYAYQNIAHELVKLSVNLPDIDVDLFNKPTSLKLKSKLRKFIGLVAAKAYKNGIELPENISNYGYAIKKNPGFSMSEISNNWNKLSGLVNQDLKNVVITKLDEDAFLAYKKND